MRESGENYLETILILKEEKRCVRSVDIANRLGYAKPSVSRAVGLLKERGFVTVGDNGDLCLTEAGFKKANAIYERHKIISKLLSGLLCVDKNTADSDACRIEHVISEESFDAIKKYVTENLPEADGA